MTFGTDSLAVSTTLNRLGKSQIKSGKFNEAQFNLKRALAIGAQRRAPESLDGHQLGDLSLRVPLPGQDAHGTADGACPSNPLRFFSPSNQQIKAPIRFVT